MRRIALLLPGQGAQHPGMAVDLHAREPAFAAAVDALFEQLGEEGRRLRSLWLSGQPGGALDEAAVAQPLLFAIGYALGRCLAEEYGVRPVAYLGHSVGELTAAALAHVFDGAGAARVMAARAHAVRGLPDGGMLAVAASPARLGPFVDPPDRADGVVVAAENAPAHTVLAGPQPRLSQVGAALREAGIAWRPVPAGQPFHSPAARPAAQVFEADLGRFPLRVPDTPVWSTRTARPVRPEEAVDPEFWAGQLAAPVLFRQALDALLTDGDPLTLVDVGPSQSLAVFARRHPAVRGGSSAVIPLLPPGRDGTWDTWKRAVDYLGRSSR
ncbi:acyltransferase domain-containing protein [Streptomyces acidiscabies]|uniref:Acyltransferase domain-containing protein n=6 Tax=Streptomyces acidiscabies TaxID=42234 RepID=A0AAP6EDU3_9ACTN|nr:acyltransferase domain-containing protein [Streptomyces acidiscabies]MBP5939983.1 acyltransferase domain-containing protein [Streptomyces sp. LBUM 1476]MBZ3911174.1 acyltransferase domain-containing protein [Streptomyces acidiscabies]MDX2959044.1 acyltransferase domain-containing protein [Streptomyces acidiscabies]MDX3023892.1 acyltransferase domain-containing protein [Streptomyces acidiscabies]MDX3788287.1 acyltransferase domain-containing protein [Streptomyces acidiscabies]